MVRSYVDLPEGDPRMACFIVKTSEIIAHMAATPARRGSANRRVPFGAIHYEVTEGRTSLSRSVRTSSGCTNHKAFLSVLIEIVGDQTVRSMHDTDASNRAKHLVAFGIGEPELSTAFHKLDDLLR